MKSKEGLWMKVRVSCALAILTALVLATTMFHPLNVRAETILDPTNPGLFQTEGTQKSKKENRKTKEERHEYQS